MMGVVAGLGNARTHIAAIDQGTTSTRCLIFDVEGRSVAVARREHRQIFPRPGWVEHDPEEIWRDTQRVCVEALERAGLRGADLAAVGITNQRETTVVWERSTGRPVCNAIVWQDTRTAELCRQLGGEVDSTYEREFADTGLDGVRLVAGARGQDRYRDITGLPLATYFAGPKLRWILDNVPGARAKAQAGELLFGTMDTWLLWHLTGGTAGGLHLTDATNASRTLLMDLGSLSWDADILAELDIPHSMLPRIRSSAEVYGRVAEPAELAGVPIGGLLGDQHAATFGQLCLSPGDLKNTYGTGCFVVLNTGSEKVASRHGLLTTVAYRLGGAAPVYALEGSIAVAGSLVQWLRDNLGLIDTAAEVEELARSVDDNGGVYVVPAFSGLFAPHWRPDARGVITGLTRFATKAHIARAALEATAFQTREVIDAMRADAGYVPTSLKVDGGMVGNELLMRCQADTLGIPVIRPKVTETTALGAAYAAGLAVGVWGGTEELRAHWAEDARWEPEIDEAARERGFAMWQKAVRRSLDWA